MIDSNVVVAFLCFAGMGLVLGIFLAYISKVFDVKVNKRVEEIEKELPGANCGGCGYTSCHSLAEAIDKGVAKTNSCRVCDSKTVENICSLMGIKPEKSERMRAQVMCSGTFDRARFKYIYEGPRDCNAVVKLGGGNKACLNGCIGFGSCVEVCSFGAIEVVDGVAKIDFDKCRGCGNCVSACPKNIIKLIPYKTAYWVGCMSVDNGKITMKNCDSGCIGCRICEKNCEEKAITINDGVASIDYSKCVGCGKCAVNCPRKIIQTANIKRHEKIISEQAIK